MYLSSSLSELGSNCDSSVNASSSTKQISNSFGSDKMITRTVAFPGVSSDVRGWIIFALRFSISAANVVCSTNGMANAMRPNAVLRSMVSARKWMMTSG